MISIKTIFSKINTTRDRIVVIVGLVVAIQGLHDIIKPFLHDSALIRFNRLEEDLVIYGRVVQAETDIDTYVHDKYGVELYHCNKDQNGQFKYSFIYIDGRPKEAKYSRTKRCWVFDNQGTWQPIRTIKKSE